MALPSYDQLMLPLLRLAGAGRADTLGSAEALLIQELQLTPDECSVRLPSGQQTVIRNRIGWASFHLMKAGLIVKPKRGQFVITDRGREVLQAPPSKLDREYLSRFPEFSEFIIGNTRNAAATTPVAIGRQDDITPDEALQDAFRQLQEELASDLLSRLLQVSQEFFESTVVELLVAMGYGGSRQDAGERIGRSGDGGIDGIIKEDRLGLDTLYIQAKRWQGTVGRPEIQKFVGALHGQRARKGVFMTTGSFSADARDYVSQIDVKVVLLDGMQIANLMIDAGVGVTPVASYVVKRIDSDYFEDT